MIPSWMDIREVGAVVYIPGALFHFHGGQLGGESIGPNERVRCEFRRRPVGWRCIDPRSMPPSLQRILVDALTRAEGLK